MPVTAGEGASKPSPIPYHEKSRKLGRVSTALRLRAELAAWWGSLAAQGDVALAHRQEAHFLHQALRLHSMLLDIITDIH